MILKGLSAKIDSIDSTVIPDLSVKIHDRDFCSFLGMYKELG
jgi:hypothetical protein